MREALALVRRDLGPDAAVLHTRELRPRGLLRWMRGSRLIEVTASATVNVPSRLVPRRRAADSAGVAATTSTAGTESPKTASRLHDDMRGRLNELESLVENLCRRTSHASRGELPDALFRLFTDLIDGDVNEELARELLERARKEASPDGLAEPALLKSRVAQMIEQEIVVGGPIRITPGQRKLVALIGPTGVGKTTTIAKLAANYRLKDKQRVGLITVDTYRIAAVEQLRTYADIIDLPMEVVSTPREMRQAIVRLADLDLVLMDTAGRSPADDVRLQELKSMLSEAKPNEVHLVLSSVAGAAGLCKTAERFSAVGVTSLVLTKLDEASCLGNLLPLLRTSKLPLSYLTDGQNVPEDIAPAVSRRLARLILGLEKGSRR